MKQTKLDMARVNGEPITQYDYDNQAWIVDGKYVACNHPMAMHCQCYGRINAGKRAPSIH